MKSKNKEIKKVRGVFEKVSGSGEWWIQFYDSDGRRRREKAGTKGNAIDLYRKRKLEALTGTKLPEKLRRRTIRFSELAEDARKYVNANNVGSKFDGYRLDRLIAEFGDRLGEIPIEDLRRWFGDQEWRPATYNRYKTTLSLVYRLGIEHKKVKTNPAKLLRRKHEDNERVRFLGQFTPGKTADEELNKFKDEEGRLRSVIERDYSPHQPEFTIALHTGLRPSEMYALKRDRVDRSRRLISIPQTKNGKARHIPLNTEAMAAFAELLKRPSPEGWVFVTMDGERLRGYKHWFVRAVKTAAIREFTWYCLRHTFASRLVMAGVNLRTVAELMGHKTIQMTMRYAHLAPEHNLAAVERLVSFNSHSGEPADYESVRGDSHGQAVMMQETSTATSSATGVEASAMAASASAS
jgi:integrase